MPVVYYTENVRLPKDFQKRLLSQWIQEIAISHHKKTGNIVYIFCDDEKILELNRRYLQHDYFTDIITFDYTEGNLLGGDLYISLDTVKSNAGRFNSSLLEELYRVMIHGILHLCGLSDTTEEERKQMTHAENNALEMLRTKLKF
jgi:rRNA maturation RNase YbeY